MLYTQEILNTLQKKIIKDEAVFAGRFGSNEILLYLFYKKVTRNLVNKLSRRIILNEYQVWNSKNINFDRP